jgi:Uma2 family endonuclease
VSNSRIPDVLLLAADELGIKLELQGDLPLWEPSPGLRHQEAVDIIRASITPHTVAGTENHCACRHYADLYVCFPDGSFKRPDISIFCRRPDEEVGAVTLVPEAVIEVLSPRGELKDLELGPPFYLMHGIKDVIVLDPETSVVVHRRVDATTLHQSPVTIDLACGCRVAV